MLRNATLHTIAGLLYITSTLHAEMSYFIHDAKIYSVAQIGDGKQIEKGTTNVINQMAGKNLGSWNIEFSGILDVPKTGKYKFSLTSDDGSALYIVNKAIIMNDGQHGSVTKEKTTRLKAGKHQVNLLYYNHTGGHTLCVTVQAPNGQPQDLASACTVSTKKLDKKHIKVSAPKNQSRGQNQKGEEKAILERTANPEALLRSIKHILKTKPRNYSNGRTYLQQAQAFVEQMPDINDVIAGDPKAKQAMKEFNQLKYQALIQENPYVDFDEILVILTDKFIKKNNWLGTHTFNMGKDRNKIARLNIKTGKLIDVYEPAPGVVVGELDLHYDAKKMLFTSTDAKKAYQVMEIGIDGSNPHQVSTIIADHVHNYGGIYLPSDNIIFSSTAPMIGVPCIGGNQSVPNLYVMGPNGENTRQLTFEQDADWYPTVLPDGKIMYLRWEYTDIMHYYSRIMMTMNPDGTNQRAIYGSQSLWPNSMFFARPLPGAAGQFSAVVTGHHGVANTGKLTLFDTNKGYAHADGVIQYIPGHGQKVTHVTVDQLYPKVKPELLQTFPELQNIVDKLIAQYMPTSSQQEKDYHELNNDFFNKCYPRLRDYYPDEMALDLDKLVDGVYPQFYTPYPINADYFLTAAELTKNDWQLYLVDRFDNFVKIPMPAGQNYRYMVDPYPLRKRERPPIIPDRVNLSDKEATCYIQNVYRGPGLKGVPNDVVDQLRVFTYAYGYYRGGSHQHLGIESGWDVKRLLGTVKVEDDGSAMFKIPANTTISIQPLDDKGRALQLFRSWLVAMPGEELSCIGCHEAPSEPPVTNKTIASSRAPQQIKPHRQRLEGYSFNAEIQPILDAYCTRCHDGSEAQKPNFKNTELESNKPGSNYSKAYYDFHKYFRRPGPESSGTMNIPYEYHASTSEGIQLLEKGHNGIKLDEDSWRRLYTWIDLNVPFYGSWTDAYASDSGRTQKTADMSARAAELRAKYALVTSDWEYAPDTGYPVNVCEEPGPSKSDPVRIAVRGWPFNQTMAQLKQKQATRGHEQSKVVDLGNGLSIKLVRIPAGQFIMGSDDETPQEQPRHRVKIEKSFWISEAEITNDLFFAFKPDHNASVYNQQWKDHVRLGYYANYDKQPAVRMSWQNAIDFCNWVERKTGHNVSLPTEAQWEWACRAGSDKAMAFGTKSADFSPFANLADESIKKFAVTGVNPSFKKDNLGNLTRDFIPRIDKFNDGQFLVSGTKQYQPNAWGLYDMHGNLAEWTRSDYVPYPYNAKQSNSLDKTTKKVVRGGSFLDRPYRATSSYRLGYLPWQGVHNVGFRIVIEE